MEWLKWGTFDTPLVDNLLCHDIALAVSAFSNVTSCDIKSQSGQETPVDALTSEFKSGEDVVATSHINRSSKEKRKRVRAIGTGGTTLVWEDELLFEEVLGVLQPIEIEAIRSLEAECRAFIKSIETGQEEESNGAFAVKIRTLLDSIQ